MTGILLWPLSTKTTKVITEIINIKRIKTKAGDISPVFANSRVPPIAEGNPEIMLAKIIIEMPLPKPLSVICSPNHIRNIVPVTNVTQEVNTKLNPGLTTTP